MDQQNMINQLQNQINDLQNNLVQAQQAILSLVNENNGLKTAKPEKFSGTNVRTWLKSISNIFANQAIPPTNAHKIKFAVSYLSGEGLQWWELVNINPEINIQTFEQFGEEIVKYFEPVNREINARKSMNLLKQMGQFSRIRDYNQEFIKYVLQIPSMSSDEQVFHYTQGLKNRIRVELERSEVNSLQAAMKLADRMDHLYDSGNSINFKNASFSTKTTQNYPTPMEIGNIQFKRFKGNKSKWLPEHVKKQLMDENKCFICRKVGCRASRHRKVPAKN